MIKIVAKSKYSLFYLSVGNQLPPLQELIIRAEDEMHARELASRDCDLIESDSWFDEEMVACVRLCHMGEPGIILDKENTV